MSTICVWDPGHNVTLRHQVHPPTCQYRSDVMHSPYQSAASCWHGQELKGQGLGVQDNQVGTPGVAQTIYL